MGWRGSRAAAVCVALCLAAAAPPALAAQQPGGAPDAGQLRLLRSAAAREAVGDLSGAEALLREALRRQPASVATILSLERVLRKEGRADALVPLIEDFLAHDPGSVLGRMMLLRTLSSQDRVAALDSAAQDWLRAAPGSQVPVRDIAQVWRTRGESRRALAVLEQGRERLGPDAFALELGAVYADLGEYGRALDEWDRAMGEDGRGFDAVRRDLRALPDGGRAMIPAFIHRLTRKPSSRARRAAAVQLAMDAGLEDDAERWAREVIADMPPGAANQFLVNVAQESDVHRLQHLAYWAYGQLLASRDSITDAPALHARAAELALAVGDTAAAERHYGAIVSAFAPGAPQRRRAGALRIQLMAKRGDVKGATAALDVFRREYPQATEIDGLAADVGEALLRRGRPADARQLIDGLKGPRCALLRGRLALAAGDPAAAGKAFTEAAGGLHGAEGTAALELATLLGALSPAAAARVAAALGAGALQPDPAVMRRLETIARDLPDGDRPALLAYTASLADAVDAPTAARLRRAIVDGYPESRQAAPALLGLARSLAQQPDSAARARTLLERLILDHPASALVPEARRRLSLMKGEVPPADTTGSVHP